MLNLDTHIVIYIIKGELSAEEKALHSEETWSISAAVFWELAKLVQLGRIELDFDDEDMRLLLESLHVWPIDLAAALASTRSDFRGDPADEIIAATSIVHGVHLLTRDSVLRTPNVVPIAL